MKKYALLLLASLPMLALGQSTHVDDYDKGSKLFQQCKTSVRLQDAPDTMPRSNEMVESVSCVSYIAGFLDGIDIGGGRICMPESSMGTLARIYVVYMEKNPKMFEIQKSVGLANALMDAYPCPTHRNR